MTKSKNELEIIGITSLGHSLCHIYMLLMAGALVAIAKEFNTSLTVITSIGTACYFIFGLSAFPAGIFTSKTNAKLTLKLFFSLSALSCLVIGFSRNLWGFAIGLCLLGLFGSLYHVSGLTLISHHIKKQGRALGIHGVAGSLGIALTPLLTGLILAVSNWRGVYLVMAIPGLIGFLILQFNRSIQPATILKSSTASKEVNNKKSLIPFFIIMLIVMGVNGLVYRGFLTALPTYLSENVHLGNMKGIVTGGLMSTIILSVGMIGQYTGGHLSDKFKMTHLYFSVLLLSLPFMFLIGKTQNIWLIISALFFALFHFPQQPVENHLISKLIPPHLVGSGYGIKFAFTFGVGSFASGLVGVVTDNYSMRLVFPILTCLIAVSTILIGVVAWSKKLKSI